MRSAPLPDNERERLDTLNGYRIMDTLPEQAYDDITFIAAQICNTPIALVSLVDDGRQWFKSRHGLDAAETPRSLAFCAYAILEPSSLFIVEDATKDERFDDNPLVTGEPHVRFYAGAPLVARDGIALGTLCVIDHQPRTMTDAQKQALQALSRQVVAQLELRKSIHKLETSGDALQQSYNALRKRARQVERSRDELADMCQMLEKQADFIERDLHRAEIIQRSLLPHDAPPLKDFCIRSLYRPGRSVGGDLFDVVSIDERYLALVIADASGHGVSAAMLSVLFKHRMQVLDEQTGGPLRPSEALSKLNDAMRGDVTLPGAFVTAVICLLDLQGHEVLLASAGHCPALHVHTDGNFELLAQTGPPLGLCADAVYGERSVHLDDGDRLLLYTDGLLDLGGSEPPTMKDLAEALRKSGTDQRSLGEFLEVVSHGQEREDRDDVTLLQIEARAGESYFFEPAGELAIEPETGAAAPEMTFAETEGATFIALSGRVTWTFADALLESGSAVLDAGRRLVIDLGNCEQLDSTLLGTLHELFERGSERDIVLQNVSDPLRASFEELSMAPVLTRIVAKPLPLPEVWQSIERSAHSLVRQRQRLLKAHEVLASLSEENREEFQSVIDALRAPDAD
jgi:serine phosphatase RsbU (regulator of sigma subunit)/anti-anti-sigma regulatory factor